MIKIINVLAVSFLAVFIAQAGHEAAHGILATFVGAQWTQYNLFFAEHRWETEMVKSGEMILTGGAAILNILVGLLAAYLFQRQNSASHPTFRLFLFYLACYNTLTGFGYLFTDPLFYQRGGDNLGDWKKIVGLLGGGWSVRLPIALIGAAGTFWMFMWIGRNAHAFFTEERMKSAVQLLLIPYFVWNITMMILGSFVPFPGLVGLIALHYFFGYFAIFWGTFMAGKWMKPKGGLIVSPLPDKLQTSWLAVSVALFLVAAFIFVPTVKI